MGFFEILIIAVVVLLVVGPERMPDAVRSVALNLGRFKRILRNARQDIEEQLGAEDIRRQLHNEEVMASLQSTRNEMEAMLKNEHGAASEKQAKHDADYDDFDDDFDDGFEHEHTDHEYTDSEPSDHNRTNRRRSRTDSVDQQHAKEHSALTSHTTDGDHSSKHSAN